MNTEETKGNQTLDNQEGAGQPAGNEAPGAPAAGGKQPEKKDRVVKIVGIIGIIVVILLAIFLALYQIGLIPYYSSYDGNIFEATAAFYNKAKEDFVLGGVPGVDKGGQVSGPVVTTSSGGTTTTSTVQPGQLPQKHPHYDELVTLAAEINALIPQVEQYNTDLQDAYSAYLASRKTLEDEFARLEGSFNAAAGALNAANAALQANAGDAAAKANQKNALAAAESAKSGMNDVNARLKALDDAYVANRGTMMGEQQALVTKSDELREEYARLLADDE